MEIIGIAIVEGDHGSPTREATLIHRRQALLQGHGRVVLRENRKLLGEVPGTDAQVVWVDLGVRDTMVQENEGLRRNQVPGPPNRSTYFLRKKHF
jgi:hypothetical protein